MGSLTIRNLDDRLKARLRLRAAGAGHSMEEEARVILRSALTDTAAAAEPNLADFARALFAPLGGVDLPEVPRDPARPPPLFPA
ncbi:MAG TPA: plasmid stabilization protein [Acetobacteraceae bacterium]|nr:plasmid stabilization protein [Acetobacteraceae bacterium]